MSDRRTLLRCAILDKGIRVKERAECADERKGKVFVREGRGLGVQLAACEWEGEDVWRGPV